MKFLSNFLRPRRSSLSDPLKPLPWIDETIIRFEWEELANNYELRTYSNGDLSESFEINVSEFSKVTSDKLSSDISNLSFEIYKNFTNALTANSQHQKFLEWWKGIAYSHGRLFQFDFSRGPWDIPWEMLLGTLMFEKSRAETTIVRCIGQPETTCKSYWTESFRSLIIKANTSDLDLEKDVKSILATWNGLEHNLKLAVLKPEVILAKKTEVIQKIRELKPHMIWFIGHGFWDKKVHLVFSNNEILTATEFAEMFDLAGHCPEFAVFWACETSKGNKAVRSHKPDLFAALLSKGIGTMVGMQSVIADDAAIAMASQLFRGMAHGLPIEWAIARARIWIYLIRGEQTTTMDWAAPVVWTARRPIAHLNWNQSEIDNLQLQLLGTISIEKGLEGAGLDAEPPDNNSYKRAEDWLPFRVTVVRGKVSSTDHRLWFLRTLKGIQALSRQAVLVVTLEEQGYYKLNLRLWAKGLLEILEKGRLPEEFFTKIDILCNDAEIGWRRLCSMENLYIAVIAPPPASEDWFWTPLFERTDRVALLMENEIPEQFLELQINYVAATQYVEITRLKEAMRNHERLLVALSLINLPVRINVLESLEFGQDANEVFKRWTDLFIRTFGGYVIRADAREKILDFIDERTIFQARFDCLQIIDQMKHSQKPYLKELRIQFLRDVGNDDNAVRELSNLLHLYYESHELVPFVRAIKKHFALRNGLTAWEWFNIAGVLLQFGEQRQVKFWLSRDPEHILDVPYKLALQAELTKNEGNIDGARELIEKAITQCKKNQDDTQLGESERNSSKRDYLWYRHDRALLLQFQEGDNKEAAKEYREIINIIEEDSHLLVDSHLQHLLAVTHRNLGECILDLDSNEIEDRLRESEAHLRTALHVENKINLYSRLISETHYQLSRLYERKKQPSLVRKELENCISTAEEGHDGLIATIAKNRFLWLDIREKNIQWKDVAERVDLIGDSLRVRLEHSWAARTLINTNINLAHLLLKEDRYDISGQYLEENLEILRSNMNLRRKGDMDRIIETLAGLQIISDNTSGKQDFWGLLKLEFSEADKHFHAKGYHTLEEAWSRSSYYGYS